MKRCLLLVEDDVLLCRALTRGLRAFFDVVSAGSCAEGCALLEARSFDIIVCDYHLGDGTAETVLGLARARQPGARRAIVSASPPPGAAVLAELVLWKPPPSDLAARLVALCAT